MRAVTLSRFSFPVQWEQGRTLGRRKGRGMVRWWRNGLAASFPGPGSLLSFFPWMGGGVGEDRRQDTVLGIPSESRVRGLRRGCAMEATTERKEDSKGDARRAHSGEEEGWDAGRNHSRRTGRGVRYGASVAPRSLAGAGSLPVFYCASLIVGKEGMRRDWEKLRAPRHRAEEHRRRCVVGSSDGAMAAPPPPLWSRAILRHLFAPRLLPASTMVPTIHTSTDSLLSFSLPPHRPPPPCGLFSAWC